MSDNENWKYDKDDIFAISVPLVEVLAAPTDNLVFQALADISNTSAGHALLTHAIQKNTRVAVDATFPAYGLVVPDDQTSNGAPQIIVTGDVVDWGYDFGVFLWAHELTHIYQMDHKMLQNFSSYGVCYESTAPVFFDDRGADVQMSETILSERMADIIGMCIVTEHLANNPESRIAGFLSGIDEVKMLFNKVSNHREGRDGAWLKTLMSAENYSSAEWRYYNSYSKWALGRLSSTYNRASMNSSEAYCSAQVDMVHNILAGPSSP